MNELYYPVIPLPYLKFNVTFEMLSFSEENSGAYEYQIPVGN